MHTSSANPSECRPCPVADPNTFEKWQGSFIVFLQIRDSFVIIASYPMIRPDISDLN